LFWRFSLGAWLPKDHLILVVGSAAMLIALLIGLRNREKHASLLVAASLAASYSLYLIRGSVMLEFYVIPLLPFLALNIGLMLDHLLGPTPAALRAFTRVLLVPVLPVPLRPSSSTHH